MKKPIIIELRGVEFVNKGAELMLYAITDYLRKRLGENVIFVMEKNGRVTSSDLLENDIYQKFNYRKFRIKFEKLAALVPRSILKKKRLILPKDIDVVLDGSGFAFGDQWGADYAYNRIGKFIKQWKKEDKKVVLLPQAFGPFTAADLKIQITNIIENADLVFAREDQSFKYLKELDKGSVVLQAPDFTNLIKGIIPKEFKSELYDVAIIPNYKMIEKNSSEEVYLNFLREAISEVKSHGLRPYFLIHEGKRDREIADKVNNLTLEPIDVVYFPHGLMVKGIISTAKFIICSRFHGVVSALSQGVPCLATSWSHKYEMLAKEYGFSEGIVGDLTDLDTLRNKIAKMSDPEYRKEISAKLTQQSVLQKEKSVKMWDIVLDKIK